MALNVDDEMEDPQADAIWIISSTFIVFTMQSGKSFFYYLYKC